MSILCSATDTLRFDSWSILFKFLMLSDAICTVLLHLSNFCFGLGFEKSTTELLFILQN